jgi:hypothetical protein
MAAGCDFNGESFSSCPPPTEIDTNNGNWQTCYYYNVSLSGSSHSSVLYGFYNGAICKTTAVVLDPDTFVPSIFSNLQISRLYFVGDSGLLVRDSIFDNIDGGIFFFTPNPGQLYGSNYGNLELFLNKFNHINGNISVISGTEGSPPTMYSGEIFFGDEISNSVINLYMRAYGAGYITIREIFQEWSNSIISGDLIVDDNYLPAPAFPVTFVQNFSNSTLKNFHIHSTGCGINVDYSEILEHNGILTEIELDGMAFAAQQTNARPK